MSEQEQKILGFTTQELIRWGIVLLLVVSAIGSIIQGGALSGSYQQSNIMIYIPVFLVMYMGILAGMYLSGLQPNNFEKVMIPVLIIVMIVVTLTVADILPSPQNPDNDGEDTADPIDTTDVFDTDNPPGTNGNDTFIPPASDPAANDGGQFDILLQNIATSLSIIFILAFLAFGLYWIVNRQEFDPDIQIHKVNEYTKSSYETNNTIIEYYIEASNEIEKLKGKAPNWFSPTNFAGHVVSSPGPPLSSYFDQITNLYEQARFGEKQMKIDEVEEAKDLHHQIVNQIKSIIRQSQQQFVEVSEEDTSE